MAWIKERIDAEFRKHYPSMFRKKFKPNLDWSLIAEKKILSQINSPEDIKNTKGEGGRPLSQDTVQDKEGCGIQVAISNGKPVKCGSDYMFGKKRYCNHCRVQDNSDFCKCSHSRWEHTEKDKLTDCKYGNGRSCNCVMFQKENNCAPTEEKHG